MAVKASNDEALENAVLKALEGLDGIQRQSGTIRRVPERTPESAPVWENEPATQRFVDDSDPLTGRHPVLPAGAERRAARRVRLEVPVEIHGKEGVFEGTSEDISTSGIFVRTSRLLHSGKKVKLRFDLPHGRVEVTAVVVRFRTPSKSGPAGVGLCFQALSTAQLQCIEAYCDSCADSIR